MPENTRRQLSTTSDTDHASLPFITIVGHHSAPRAGAGMHSPAAAQQPTGGFFSGSFASSKVARDVFEQLTRSCAREALRVWVTGCATGDEAYSIAIAYTEFCSDSGCTVPLRLVGTDDDDVCIAASRRGVYSLGAIRGVSAERRQRFFQASGDGFKVCDAVRNCCTFLRHDVMTGAVLSGADLVIARNVAGGMRPDRHSELVERLRGAVRGGGILWTGSAKTSTELVDSQEPRR